MSQQGHFWSQCWLRTGFLGTLPVVAKGIFPSVGLLPLYSIAVSREVRVRKWANRFCSQCVNKAEPQSVCSVHELISNKVPNLIIPLLSSLSVGHFSPLTFKMFVWGFVRGFKFLFQVTFGSNST